MDGPRTCGATFVKWAAPNPAKPAPVQLWTLTITKPTGGTILGDNINCGPEAAECEAKFIAGYTMTLHPTADHGYRFVGFTGNCGPAGEVVMDANRTCSARFEKEVVARPAAAPIILVVTRPQNGTILGNGINCGPAAAQCSSPQQEGTVVHLQPRPDRGFVFTGFTGDCIPSGVVVMAAGRVCGATFAKADSRLPAASFPTLTVERPSHGTASGPGIQCGTGGSQCKAPQPVGSTVQLRVQPDPGYFFLRFSGDCDAGGRTVMEVPRKCTVVIERPANPLSEQAYPTLTVIKPTGGTVLGNGINCGTGGSACSARQPAARQVRLLALPDVGFVFVRFTGDCDESGVMMMNAPQTCSATFAKGGK
jgi:hypothetical protein